MKRILVLTLTLTILTFGVALAGEYKKEGWPMPPADQSVKVKYLNRIDHIEECPGVDVVQELWVIPAGALSPEFKATYDIDLPDDATIRYQVNKLIDTGQPVSIYMDTDDTHPMDITLVDENGDGTFRLRHLEGRIPTPQWVREHCLAK